MLQLDWVLAKKAYKVLRIFPEEFEAVHALQILPYGLLVGVCTVEARLCAVQGFGTNRAPPAKCWDAHPAGSRLKASLLSAVSASHGWFSGSGKDSMGKFCSKRVVGLSISCEPRSALV